MPSDLSDLGSLCLSFHIDTSLHLQEIGTSKLVENDRFFPLCRPESQDETSIGRGNTDELERILVICNTHHFLLFA